MQVASIDENRIVLNVIIATLEEAQSAFPDQTWEVCPAWVGIGMDINTPKPEPILEPLTEQGAA